MTNKYIKAKIAIINNLFSSDVSCTAFGVCA